MPRLRLRLAYQGTRYAGWQLQAHVNASQPPTIQGELERVASAVLGLPRVPVVGCSRTDAGVHAECQICRLDIPAGTERIDWQRAFNARLPDDIRVLDASLVPDDFAPHRGVVFKRYSYSLWTARTRPLPRIAPFVGAFPPLDLERIDAALPHFVGKHDWACMRNTGANPALGTARTIFSLTRRPHMVGPLRCPEDWPVWSLVVEGDGFLKQMVRNMVGLLAWIGLGKIDPDDIPRFLAKSRREDLPSPTAPASGLTLMWIEYADGNADGAKELEPPTTPA